MTARRYRVNGKGLAFREYLDRPDLADRPTGQIVFDGGAVGRHDGQGQVLIYGEGYHYAFVDPGGRMVGVSKG